MNKIERALTTVLTGVALTLGGGIVCALMAVYWLFVLGVLAIPIALTAAIVLGVMHLCGVSL